MTPNEPKEPVCVFSAEYGPCNPVTDDDYCYGCKEYVCAEHSVCATLRPGHDCEDHLSEDDGDEP